MSRPVRCHKIHQKGACCFVSIFSYFCLMIKWMEKKHVDHSNVLFDIGKFLNDVAIVI